MIQKAAMKSCCGRSAVTYTLSKPIRRHHVDLFTGAGFLLPERYIRNGLFYARKEGFNATCNFGLVRVVARCSGPNCAKIFSEFENILDKIQKEN